MYKPFKIIIILLLKMNKHDCTQKHFPNLYVCLYERSIFRQIFCVYVFIFTNRQTGCRLLFMYHTCSNGLYIYTTYSSYTTAHNNHGLGRMIYFLSIRRTAMDLSCPCVYLCTDNHDVNKEIIIYNARHRHMVDFFPRPRE